MADSTAPLLQVAGLVKHFPIRAGLFSRVHNWIHAVDNVSFDIRRGEVLGLVGESGCGKTTVGRTILRLYEPTAGTVIFDDVPLHSLDRSDLRVMRRRMQIMFQDPYESLNPRMTVGSIIGEPLQVHGFKRAERRARVQELLDMVGLSPFMPTATHTSSAAVSASASVSRAPSPSTPTSSSATSRSARSMSPSRRRSSICSWTCSSGCTWPICSSPTT
jgi:oligopeptide transport system ATP-binding protein